MILVIHYYTGAVDGVFTSMVDTYYNLLEAGKNVEFKIVCDDASIAAPHIKRNFRNQKLISKLTKDLVFDYDIIICSSCLLYHNLEVFLKTDNLIILDSLDLAFSKYGKYEKLSKIFPGDNCTILTNPSTMNSTGKREFEYYHKFSRRRINNLQVRVSKFSSDPDKESLWIKNEIDFYRSERPHTLIVGDKYFENIGKIIFEHLIFEKKVNYYTNGMFTKDGLYYYLKLIGIDGEINHTPIEVNREIIFEKLFPKEDDLLFEMVNNV